MGINHYTTLFIQESQNESPFLLGTGVTNIQDDKYPNAASEWMQVSRQGTSKNIHHTGLHICSCIYIYWNFIRLEIQFRWNYCFYFLFC
jgi:hypothetical protein